MVVIESHTESGDVAVTLKALPVLDYSIMQARVFGAHVRGSDSPFHPGVDVVLVGVERTDVADERHSFRDEPGVSLVGNLLNKRPSATSFDRVADQRTTEYDSDRINCKYHTYPRFVNLLPLKFKW